MGRLPLPRRKKKDQDDDNHDNDNGLSPSFQEMLDAADRDEKRRPPMPESKAPASWKYLEKGDNPLKNKAVGMTNGYTDNMSYITELDPEDRPLYFQWRDMDLPDVRKDYKLNRPQKDMWWQAKTYLQKNIWYYRDRMNVPRGPCDLPTLKECWVHGIIDDQTLVWGQGLVDFLPVRNVRTLIGQIRTPEVRFAAWVKKNIALKPALKRIRQERAEHRPGCDQADWWC